MPTIIFLDCHGTEYATDADLSKTVMQAAVNAKVPSILAECGGLGACGTCHAYVDAAWADCLPPPTSTETDMLGFVLEPRENSRLTCQLKVTEALDRMVIHLPRSQI